MSAAHSLHVHASVLGSIHAGVHAAVGGERVTLMMFLCLLTFLMWLLVCISCKELHVRASLTECLPVPASRGCESSIVFSPLRLGQIQLVMMTRTYLTEKNQASPSPQQICDYLAVAIRWSDRKRAPSKDRAPSSKINDLSI